MKSETGSYRITTIRTRDLCVSLDCEETRDGIDAALSDAGYVRLDHGLPPKDVTAITAVDRPCGLDPGHRGPALGLAAALLHVVHADGRPDVQRVKMTVSRALTMSPTDHVGESIAAALAAYAGGRDVGEALLDPQAEYADDPDALAAAVYETARYANIVTDVALERATTVGSAIDGWESRLLGNIRAEEPVVRVRRHDARDYEAKGIEPPLAELIAYVKANPKIDVDRFSRYAKDVGLDPREAGMRITEAMAQRPALTGPGNEDQDSEKGGPSSTT